MMIPRVLASAVLLLATGCKPPPPGDDGGAIGDEGGEIDVLSEVTGDVGSIVDCRPGDAPAPRRYAQMAFNNGQVTLDLPNQSGSAANRSPTGGLVSSRGVLLFGGQSPIGENAFDDLWYLDLTDTRELRPCDWYRLSDHVPFAAGAKLAADEFYPTFGGALVATSDEFLLVSGYQVRGRTTASWGDVWSLGLGGGVVAPLFFRRSSNWGGVTALAVRQGDETCAENVVTCYYNHVTQTSVFCDQKPITGLSGSPCTGTFSYPGYEELDPDADDYNIIGQCPTAASGSYQTDYRAGSYKPGCADDPFCTGDGQEERSGSAGGRGFAAVTYDPVDDTIEIHGGTSGCQGPEAECTGWVDLLRLDDVQRSTDTSGLFYASTSDIVFLTGEGLFDATGHPGTAAWGAGWMCPELTDTPATFGLHHTAAAMLGVRWDPVTRTFGSEANAPQQTYAFGGSRYQVVPPGLEHLTTNALRSFTDGFDEHTCAPVVIEGNDPAQDQLIADCGNDSLEDGSTGVTSAVRFGGGNYGQFRAPDFGQFHSAAAAALDNDSMVVVGGAGIAQPFGRDAVQIVNTDGTVFSAVGPGVIERFGASAVWDPLYKRAIVFGGSASDQLAYAVTPEGYVGREVVNQGSFETIGTYVKVQSNSVGSLWTTSETIDLEYECDTQGGTEPCWADEITINYQTFDADTEIWSNAGFTHPKISYVDRGTSARLLSEYETPSRFDRSTASAVTYSLPEVIANGEHVQITLDGWQRVLGPANNAFLVSMGHSQLGVRSFAFGSPSASGYTLVGLPMWVGPVDGVQGIETIDVEGPAGMAIIGPGAPTETGVVTRGGVSVNSYSGGMLRRDDPIALILPGVHYVGAAATVHAWADDALVQSPFPYVTGGSLEGDVGFLEDRLGGALPYWSLLYVRRGFGDGDLEGLTTSGLSIVTAYDITGAAAVNPPRTTLHELAHAWFGVERRVDTPNLEQVWLIEGMPRLLEVIRYEALDPTSTHPSPYLSTVPRIFESHPGPDETNLLKFAFSKTRDGEHVAAYTLAQFHFVARGASTDDQIPWQRWQDLVSSTSYGQRFSALEVVTALGSSFYIDWVAPSRIGTPLLKISYAQWDPGGDSGSALDMGRVDSPDEIVVSQVGNDLHSWPLRTTVPYFLACGVRDDPGVRAFAQCDGTGLVIDSPQHNADFDADDDGVAEASRRLAITTSSDLPQAGIALIAADRLVPERLLEGALGWPDRAYCAWGVCADVDGDGWPADSECDDSTFNINPGVHDSYGAPDEDCDGWGVP